MPPAAQPAPNPIAMFFPIILMFGIFYLLVFRPQSKARKEHEQMLKDLSKHDEVVTRGGVIGTVLNLKPDRVTLKVDENVRLEVERSAIVRVVKSRGGESA